MAASETSLAQPTPGPLHVVTHAPDVHTVRTASNWETASCRTKANAALYAASPCLLAACEQYISASDYLYKTEMHDNYTDRARARNKQAEAIEMMRAAVQKARGKQP